MKPESMMIDDVKLTIKTLRKMGYKTTAPRNKSANGVDIFAIKNDRVLSVEIKTAKPASKTSNVLRVRPVELNRKKDDLISIVLPNGYVLIEPMRDHLKVCSKSGLRFLNY